MAEGRAGGAALPGVLSAVAHELRTPLAAVSGAAAALRREGLDDEARGRLVGVIESASAELSGLVDDLLVAARLDAGRLPVELTRVDAVAIARSVLEAVLEPRPGARLSLAEPGAVPPFVLADAVRLRQTLANLVENALRHTAPETEVVIRYEREGDRARIAVTDSGPGIAPGDRERIFEPFVRLSETTPGTGLGLFLARELARAMGGDVVLVSEPGGGATFTIELAGAPPAHAGNG